VEYFLRHLFLDGKMMGMKFKKNIVVSSKTIYRAEVFVSFWDVENVFEVKIR
jgi:hypothetical protein